MANQYPSYFAQSFALGNATTSADSLTFGFEARALRVENHEAVDIYVRLTSTALGLATSADYFLRACGGMIPLAEIAPLSGLSAYTTSTAATNKLLRVLALGG